MATVFADPNVDGATTEWVVCPILISDDFNRTEAEGSMNSVWNQFIDQGIGLGADGTHAYVEVHSQPDTARTWAYYNVAMCSADMSVEFLDLQSNGPAATADPQWICLARVLDPDTSGNGSDYYGVSITQGSSDSIKLRKVIAGSFSTIDSAADVAVNGNSLKLIVDGATQSGELQGVEKVSATDADITVGRYSGMVLGNFRNVNGTDTRISDFEAATV